MVWTARKNGCSAVKLFSEHDAGEHVGPDHGAKAEREVGLGAQSGGDAVSAADHKGCVLAPRITPLGELGGEIGAGEHAAAFIKADQDGTCWDGTGKKVSLGRHAATAFVFNLVFRERAKAKRAACAVKPLRVVINQRAFGACT
jgi:hypothetical protein